MKYILITTAIVCILSCLGCRSNINEDKSETVYRNRFTAVYKVKIDSITYLIARTPNGVAIIKHGK